MRLIATQNELYPGLTEEMLSFVVEKIEAFFGVNF